MLSKRAPYYLYAKTKNSQLTEHHFIPLLTYPIVIQITISCLKKKEISATTNCCDCRHSNNLLVSRFADTTNVSFNHYIICINKDSRPRIRSLNFSDENTLCLRQKRMQFEVYIAVNQLHPLLMKKAALSHLITQLE